MAIARRWQQSGLEVDEQLIEHGTHTFESGVARLAAAGALALPHRHLRPGNDEYGGGRCSAVAHAQGIDAPARCVGGRLRRASPLSRCWPGLLTTVRQPIQAWPTRRSSRSSPSSACSIPALRRTPCETLEYEFVQRIVARMRRAPRCRSTRRARGPRPQNAYAGLQARDERVVQRSATRRLASRRIAEAEADGRNGRPAASTAR